MGGLRARRARRREPSGGHAPGAEAARSRRAELLTISQRTAIGFLVMGFIGFFVKLILYVTTPPPAPPRSQTDGPGGGGPPRRRRGGRLHPTLVTRLTRALPDSARSIPINNIILQAA